ncbi:MAG: acyltransferase family protein, partial [Nitrospirales bacterium]
RVLPLSFLGLVLICWLIDAWPVYVPSSEALLFFSFGGYLASIRKSLFNLDQFGAVIVISYLALITIDVLTRDLTFNPYLHKIAILLGVSAALFSTKCIAQNERLQSLIVRLSGASFFVYAIHEPLLTILRKISYRIISPSSPSTIIALYIVIPTITILFAVVAYRGFARVAPKLASVVTGGR